MGLSGSIKWMGAAQLASLGFQFAASVVLARLLTPYDMGIYAVAVATVGLLAIIQAFGLQSLIVREEQLTEDVKATAFTINVAIALILSISTALLSVAGGKFLHDAGVRQVMLALAINPLFGIFEFLPGARLERAGRFGALSKSSILSGFVSAASTIIFAVLGSRFMSAVYAGWLGSITYMLMINYAGREYIQFNVGFRNWKRVGDFGFQMFATGGLHNIGSRLSDLSLAKFQGLAPLGVYSRSSSLNNLIWNNIHLAVGRVMFVDFAELHRNGLPLRERYIATVDVITAILWPAFAGFAILAGPLINVVYGHRWLNAALPLSILSLSSIVLVSITMTWEVFSATGNLRTQTRIEFIFAIVATAAFLFGSWFGLIAAASSRLASSFFAVYLYRPHLNRMTGTKTSDFLPLYARSAILTLLAVGPCSVLMIVNQNSPDTPLVFIIASVILGFSFWVAGLFVLRHRLVDEVRSLIKRRVREA